MVTKAQIRATTKYLKTHMRQYVVRFRLDNEADMIEWLDKSGNVTKTIKKLIRDEMEKEKNKKNIR